MIDLDKIIKIRPTGITLENGKLLVSSPILHDYYFGRSVVLITDHQESGSMGFILNKPTDFFVADMIEGFPDMDLPLYSGGPVQTDSIFILHCRPDIIDDSTIIDDKLAWGGDFSQIQDYLHQGIIAPSEIKFFLGYSGWGKDQLDEEISNESWIICESNKKSEILSYQNNEYWNKTVNGFGNRYENWFKIPSNPSDN